MKIAVIYDSKTGNTKQAAEWIAEGMNGVADVEAKAMSIAAVDQEFIKAAKGIVVGSPSYAATMTPALHTWVFSNMGKLGFAGKLGGAFATEQYSHGGGSLVLQAILQLELVGGMLFYSSGASCGHPVIHLGPVGVNNNVEKHNGMDLYKENFMIYGKRFAEKAKELF